MENATMAPTPAASFQQQQAAQPQAPLWSEEETRELISVRGELEKEFSSAKRNRNLWEVVSLRLRELGFERSTDQCKCKWKNLLNRFKGKETINADNGRKFPFFDELNRLFSEKASNLQRARIDSESPSASGKNRAKRTWEDQSSDEISEYDEENDNESDGDRPSRENSQRRKVEMTPPNKSSKGKSGTRTSRTGGDEIHDLLTEFFQQQRMMETQWKEMTEKHAHERLSVEQEWRNSMVQLEKERLLLEKAWREREEQRRMREEGRAERRDALITSLLNSLLHKSV
ncbi:hypothetical protein MLD38_019101 [Melastoma candidum]|uniref:Uncharacterized protein n=1 Tax=Melastoma candidum TaxID=119954 RepID=A0ACB9QZ05_9MYRT|nr:hypothetical protein MLD38_019101 [Melastoma candidum]